MTLRDEALKLHLDNNGKLEVHSKVALKDGHDLALAYTPGVAEPCKDIKVNPELSFEYTCRGNMVAICTDGTRVLGLGNIGLGLRCLLWKARPSCLRALAMWMRCPYVLTKRMRRNLLPS